MDQETDPRTALLLFCFLEDGSSDNKDLQEELTTLKSCLTPSCGIPAEEDDVQSDGHICCNPRQYLDELQPQALPLQRGDIIDEEAVRIVAGELVQIADQLERTVIFQATFWNLFRNLQNRPEENWKFCLSREVEKMLHGGLTQSLDQLPKERLMLALTFTFVKGVCQHAPNMLQRLFRTALQYVHNFS
ncbi:BH3 interacting domain death agonist [Paramormyrops kingsleyae]|uniref:BH3-interacting domain death agonist n=1 Tax=Paramormyrops kingsleyae TaxID=1676925 RepID=A0A3B3TE11_9TELE